PTCNDSTGRTYHDVRTAPSYFLLGRAVLSCDSEKCTLATRCGRGRWMMAAQWIRWNLWASIRLGRSLSRKLSSWFVHMRLASGVGVSAMRGERIGHRPRRYGVRAKGDVLRSMIHSRGLTGAGMAEKAGVSASTVSQAMAGQPIHPAKLRAIVAALAAIDPLPGMDVLVDPGNLGRAANGAGGER